MVKSSQLISVGVPKLMNVDSKIPINLLVRQTEFIEMREIPLQSLSSISEGENEVRMFMKMLKSDLK